MTEALVQFADRAPTPAGSVCTACGFDSLLVQDHCHEHGWLRAIVCMRCNQFLDSIDRRIPPGVGGNLLAALLAVRNRCPDCETLGGADLVRQRPKRTLAPSGDPQARADRLRRLAAKRGYKLVKVRDSGAYELMSPRRPYRRVLASIEAVGEFLAH